MGILSKELVDEQISGWEFVENRIEKSFQLSDFNQALTFVNKVAEVAERVNHHPDIQISYNVVKINLSTHSENGVTEKDIELAKEIEKLK